MRDSIAPKLSKWPFFLWGRPPAGHGLSHRYQSKFVLGHWELCFVVLCVAGGALLGIAPYLLEYDALVKVAEAGALSTVVSESEEPGRHRKSDQRRDWQVAGGAGPGGQNRGVGQGNRGANDG